MTDRKILRPPQPLMDVLGKFTEQFDNELDIDWGDDDEVLTCGVENPDVCESCQ